MRASRILATGGLCCFVDSDIDKNDGNLRVCSQSSNCIRPLVVLQEIPLPTGDRFLCLVALVECDPQLSGSSAGGRMNPQKAYRTCRLAHVRREVLAQMFNVPIADDQMCVFVEPGVIEQLQAIAGPTAHLLFCRAQFFLLQSKCRPYRMLLQRIARWL